MSERFKALKEAEDSIEFWRNKTPKCPHCGSDFDIEEGEAWELYTDDGGMGHEVECQDCNLTFTVMTHTSYLFSTDEQDYDEEEDEGANVRGEG